MATGWLWRLTRSGFGRSLYDALAKFGLKVSLLYEYTRSLHGELEQTEHADGIVLETLSKSEFDASEAGFDAAEAIDDLAATDTVVLARANGTIVGYVFCSVSGPVYVDVIETEVGMDPDTAYIWQLHVDTDHRRRGIGTALVERTCRVAANEATTVTALVTVDNTPSKALFESAGFEREELLIYGRVFGLSHRWSLSALTE